MRYGTGIALALAAATALPAAALAADYDPPIYVDEAPEYTPVEVGSGWYLRGDVGYAFKRDYKNQALSSRDAVFDSELMGLGWIGPLDAYSLNEKQGSFTGSVGFGYHFNDWFRADVTIGALANDRYSATGHLTAGYLDPYAANDTLNIANDRFGPTGGLVLPDFGCQGTRTVTTTDLNGNPVGNPSVVQTANWRRDCTVSASTTNKAWNGLANGYVDLGTYAGFTPYIGAGIGLLQTKTRFTVDANCNNSSVTTEDATTRTTVAFNCAATSGQTTSYNKTNYDLMYGLMAGVSYQVSKNTAIDVGYQYLSAPEFAYYSIDDNGISRHKGLDAHQIKVGLRYDLW